mgnify:CR=1 FL=1
MIPAQLEAYRDIAPRGTIELLMRLAELIAIAKQGDVTVRASSVDIRTVGAGGGSIAHVPELTGALRVGPQSAGADPGKA